ncbi:SRPBCC family protein [Acidiferrobacter sp.]|uniref:SRPBCC family protein n=1 Tax=Acidiferrobacter sp. TaxID=1872107 RepID=UPI00260D3250|nr:SRPBCC family protein [Acidiferrobacter sp.]
MAASALGTAPAWAGQAPMIAVSGHDGRYHMSLELMLRAPVRRVWHVITDYGAIGRLNPAVKKSVVIRRDGLTVLRMHIRSCVLFICFPVTQTESMTTHGRRFVRGIIIPELSSFRSGYSQWRLRAVPGGTQARFEATLTPAFFIPPLIGPWLIRGKLVHEMRTTASRLTAWVDAKTPHKA